MTEKLENQPDTRPEPDTSPQHGGDAVPIPAHAPISAVAPRPTSKVADLSTSKVLAGGMAAATSAVFGSHFGAFGTVGGAAVGSVVTTVGANLYQRSLERARDRVARQIPLPATLASRTSLGAGKGAATAGCDAAGSDAAGPGAEPVVAAPAAPFPLGRLIGMSLVGAVLFFALGIGLVTGIEWAKGSPLSGGTGGTSVGQAFAPVAPNPAPIEQERPVTGSDAPSEPGTGSDGKKSDKSEKSDKSDKSDKDRSTSVVPTTPSVPLTPSAPIAPSAPLPLPGIGLPGG